MAASDQLPPLPTRGGGQAEPAPTDMPFSGSSASDVTALLQDQEGAQQKQDVQEVMQKMRREVGQAMRQFQTYAGQFPAASKEADNVQKALDQFLRAIVKNAPGRSEPSPMVSA